MRHLALTALLLPLLPACLAHTSATAPLAGDPAPPGPPRIVPWWPCAPEEVTVSGGGEVVLSQSRARVWEVAGCGRQETYWCLDAGAACRPSRCYGAAAFPEQATVCRDPAADATAGDPTRKPPAAAPPLRLATWNVKRLGHGQKRLELVARAIGEFDVIAVQEVMKREVVDELLALLPGWKAVVSERALGRSTYKEHYAVFYRPDRVEVTSASILEDPRDAFAREPFVVCFRAAPAFDACLVSVHVVFGKKEAERNAEVQALGELVDSLRAGAEKDWIYVGDWNLARERPGWRAWLAAGWQLVEGNVPSTFAADGYKSAYDHIVLDPAHTAEWTGTAARYDLVERICEGDFGRCADELSDHAPVSAEFGVAGPDDD